MAGAMGTMGTLNFPPFLIRGTARKSRTTEKSEYDRDGDFERTRAQGSPPGSGWRQAEVEAEGSCNPGFGGGFKAIEGGDHQRKITSPLFQKSLVQVWRLTSTAIGGGGAPPGA